MDCEPGADRAARGDIRVDSGSLRLVGSRCISVELFSLLKEHREPKGKGVALV